MRIATWKDRALVAAIMLDTFRENPGVNWMFRPFSDISVCLERMARYALVKSCNRNGAWIASNEKGLIFFFEAGHNPFSFRERWYEIVFALTCIGWEKLSRVLRRESIRRSLRPADKKYLYCWFLAVQNEGRGAAYELKNFMFSESIRRKLPIYLETSALRNKIVYERIGFNTYYEWIDEEEGIHLWFMKWEPRENVQEKEKEQVKESE